MAKAMISLEFAEEIAGERSIFDALERGLEASECEPGSLHDAWAALEAQYRSPQLQKLVVRAAALLAAQDTEIAMLDLQFDANPDARPNFEDLLEG